MSKKNGNFLTILGYRASYAALATVLTAGVSLAGVSLGVYVDRNARVNQSDSSDDNLNVDDYSGSSIPEPASGALLGLGTVVLLRRRHSGLEDKSNQFSKN